MLRSSVPLKTLQVALRVLQAYSNYTPPLAADEAYLRKVANDTTTPSDELACQIAQDELRKHRAENKAPVSVGAA
jgi:hypothetical protein